MSEHYAVLGVPRTASTEQVRSAYRRLARLHHPDHGGSVAAFHVVQQAHHVLGDTERRARYDRELVARRDRLREQRRDESLRRQRDRREAVGAGATSQEYFAVPRGWGMEDRIVAQRTAAGRQHATRAARTNRLDTALELVNSMLWGVAAAMVLILVLAVCASLFLV